MENLKEVLDELRSVKQLPNPQSKAHKLLHLGLFYNTFSNSRAYNELIMERLSSESDVCRIIWAEAVNENLGSIMNLLSGIDRNTVNTCDTFIREQTGNFSTPTDEILDMMVDDVLEEMGG